MRTLRTPLSAAVAGLIGLFLSFATSSIHAVPMNVTANVQQACELNNIADAAFGPITPGGGDQSTTSQIGWRCTNGTNANIEIDNGNNFSVGTRHMDDGSSNEIAYSLWQDGGFSTPWGSVANGEELGGLSGAGMASFTNITVHALLVDAAYIAALPGSYSDTVQVTINIVP